MDNPVVPAFASKKQRLKARLTYIKARASLKPVKNKALICPPTTPGSLGDEAMVQALVDSLLKKGVSSDLMVINKNENWKSIKNINQLIEVGDREYNLKNIYIYSKYGYFYLLGADVLDGYYSKTVSHQLLWQAWLANLSCNTTIAGFSLNSHPSPSCLELFRILPSKTRICIRDENSRKRFNDRIQRQSIQVADLAFLLEPESKNKKFSPIFKWVNDVRVEGDKVLGLNISSHSFAKIKNFKRNDILEIYHRELRKLLAEDLSINVLLIPHDTRGTDSDERFLFDLYDKIGTSIKKRVRIIKPPISAATVKSLVGELDAVISGRMHLSIACFGMSTPVACVSYQGKFEGLYKLFGLENLTLPPEKAVSKGALYNLAKDVLSKKEILQERINKKKHLAKELALKNIE